MLKIYGKSKIVKRIVMSIVGLFLLAIPAGFIIVNHFAHNSNAATPTTVTPDSGPTAGGTPITITGDFSPPQPKTMQEMTVEYCASMTEFDGSNADAILTLYDARGDGASKVQAYRVAKLADGNCWMLDNLRFQLTEGMVLDGKTSNITGSGNPTVRFNWLGYNASGVTRNGNFVTNGYLTKTGATFSSASDQDAWRQVDPTSNAYCNDGQTYNPDSLTKCGYLYNWYTATAGSLDSGTVSADNIAPSSICPAGWRLPRGYNADATRNDFAVLNGYMHGDGAPNQDNPANSDYAKNWLQGGPFQGTLSGSWNTTYNGIHITGDLWSSTRVSNTNAFAADFGNAGITVWPAGSNANFQNQLGMAVRCTTPLLKASSVPTVTIGGTQVSADSITDNGDGTTTITATTPSGTAGTTDIIVSINGSDFTLPDAFTYYDPMNITDIMPDKGPVAGQNQVSITGENLLSPAAPTAFQTFTADDCATLAINDETTLKDNRNDRTYTVRRLADGKCWMVDNLKIAGYLATPDDTNLTTISDFYIPPLDTTTNTSDDDPYVYGPVPGDSGNPDDHNFGYLYNFPAATAGETHGFMSNNAENSICPSGWRLPIGGTWDEPENDFGQLNIAMYNGVTDSANYSDPAHYANWDNIGPWQGVLAGRYFGGGSFGNVGTVGFYWSSLADSPTDAYSLTLNSNFPQSVSPDDVGALSRNIGAAVRCLTDPGTPKSNTPTVKFGDDLATDVQITDNGNGTQTITATVPAHSAGVVTVTVNNGLTSATTTYTYYDPMKITSITPDKGPVADGTVVKITGNFPELPKPTLQEMTQEYCESMPIYDKTNPDPDSTVTIKDARNGQTYDIRRLQDGNCWMIDNLKLELTDGMVLTPDDTNVVNNTTVWLTQDGTENGTQLTGMSGNFTTSDYMTRDGGSGNNNSNYDAWRQADPSDQNQADTTNCVNGNAYDATSETGCGYLYNYYTATASTGPQGYGSSGTIAPGSICPAGWRLPSGNALINDLPILNASMYANTLTTPGTLASSGYNADWLMDGSFRGVASGSWFTGFLYQNDSGNYWTSVISSSTTAWNLDFGVGFVNPGNNVRARYYGFAVRCVTDGSANYNPITDNPLYDRLTVEFDGVPATDVSISDDRKTITATTPAHSLAAYVDVTVDSGLSSATLKNGFVYYNPLKITKINPDHGLTDGDTTVTITGSGFDIPTMPAPTTMQEMTQEYCKTMSVGDTLTLPDVRDDQDYDIRKLADDKCWMITNLKIGSASETTLLTDDDTDLNDRSTFTLPQLYSGQDPLYSSQTAPFAYGPVPGDSSGEAGTPTSNAAIADSTFYGYLYNWTAAVAEDDSTPLFVNGEISPNSVCPRSWRLPRGSVLYDPNNEWDNLSAKMAGYSSNLDPGYLNYPEHDVWYLYGGWWSASQYRNVAAGSWSVSGTTGTGDFGWQGMTGGYWSSVFEQSYGNPIRHLGEYLYISSGSVFTDAGHYSDYGYAIRCVIDGGVAQGGLSVEFDGVDVAEIVSVSDTEIVVRTPAGSAGLVDVKVDNGLTSDTVDDGYLYYDELKITGISPNHGFTDGGTEVTITGTNFDALTTPKPTTMQQMTQTFCDTLPVYDNTLADNDPHNLASTITLPDNRDGTIYTIRRLQDNKCWMIDNLKLELENDMVLTPSDTNVARPITVDLAPSNLNGNFTTSGYLTQDGSGTINEANLSAWRQVDPSSATTCANGTAYNPASLTGCGYLYNYYTTTVGTAPQDVPATGYGSPKGQSTGSICPSGWRLPIALADNDWFTNSDFATLHMSMNANTYTPGAGTDYHENTHWLPTGEFRGVMAGRWNSGFYDTDRGRYYSTTVASATNAFFLYVDSGTVFPGNDATLDRSNGLVVRCVADNTQYPIVTFDGVRATVKSHTDTEIVVTTPAHTAGLVNVTVSNGLSTDTWVDGYQYEPPYINISTLPSSVDLGGGLIRPATSGSYVSASNDVYVKTNHIGYELDISTNSATSNGLDHDSLPGVSIAAVGGSLASPAVLVNNTWGFTLLSPSDSLPVWVAVPKFGSALQIKATSQAYETGDGDKTVVQYGVKVDYSKPAGVYSNVVVYTVTGK